MKEVRVPFMKSLNPNNMGKSVQQLLQAGAVFAINEVNWPEAYPYAPDTQVHIAHTDEHLYILYEVRGLQLRAMAVEDQQSVWEDSCVEFFCRVPGSAYYMNFETNCIGTVLAARRTSKKENLQRLSPAEMLRIVRFTTLPHLPIEEKDGTFEWQVAVAIPLSLIFQRPLNFPEILEANFYKCADKTRYPHFVSWCPIHLPTPNFHCPEFFGRIVLE